MDKTVRDILVQYGVKEGDIDKLASELIKAHCVIYKSEMPPLIGHPIHFVDGTPDKNYPLRILRAYRQNCDVRWAESAVSEEPTTPILVAMNKANKERAELLDRAIQYLLRQNKTNKGETEGWNIDCST